MNRQHVLHFFRHAKPIKTGVLLGKTNISIDPTYEIKPISHNSHINLISSPLKRCTETASRLFPFGQCSIEPALREFDFGCWDGVPYEQLWQENSTLGDFWHDPWSTKPPQGESMVHFHTRVMTWWTQFLTELVTSPNNQTFAFVTHAGVMKLLLLHLMGVTKPTGQQLANLEIGYLSQLKVVVLVDENAKAWPKVVF
ncbi:Alpha-ribazole-5'-phosphate phosphatase [Pseudoalteromonas luteoviolacea B = ATCC 29581]|nr:Alpha-ribazole-5'-phosphate phosphatase [Pseudoalteromonas luteoviolacea B = ATCC 29581]